MGYCSRCGASLGDYSSDMLCSSCQSSQHGTGTPEDVPCQRCGMYLPPHELRMWNSRLYCAYCIMDIQDEDARQHKRAKPSEPAAAAAEPRVLQPESGRAIGSGKCERCGTEARTLYSWSGRMLCEKCYAEESGRPPSDYGRTFFARVAVRVKRILHIGNDEPPKIIEVDGREDEGSKEDKKGLKNRNLKKPGTP